MFERPRVGDEPAAEPMSTDELACFVKRLPSLATSTDAKVLIERIGLLERVKSVASAVQARTTVAFVEAEELAQRAAGVSARRIGQGIANQVALARRESPRRASRYIGWAQVLVQELPNTYAALERGDTSEWRAFLVARETLWLTREQRSVVDERLADVLGDLGDREVAARTRKLAYGVDPHGFVKRSAAAAKDRRVSLRPAPDTMARLSALLPVAAGVAAIAALTHAADSARAAGDPRTRGQVMADTLVERITGKATADGTDAEIMIVMPEDTLLGEGSEPGVVVDYGPVPAGVARAMARGTDESRAWVRRVFTDPVTGVITAVDTRRRSFPARIRRAVIIRDEICRTPWCSAPIRHIDHVEAVAEGGETTFRNAQGLCEMCNYAKEAPGWRSGPSPGPTGSSDEVITTTPTGHTYRSRSPLGLLRAKRAD